jgi:hypothetical protein
VRERYAEDCRRGFTLYPLNRPAARRTEPEIWEGFGVVTSAAEVAKERWDQVYLTVSSTALRGPWLEELAAATGNATVVLLQPGLDDRVYGGQRVGEGRLVQGMISLISYHAPLPGETRFPRPGMAYWFPPASPSPMSGPAARRDAVVAALRAGGLPARAHRDVARASAFPTAVMMPLLVALEESGWSFARAFSAEGRPRLAAAAAAGREATSVVARTLDARAPWLLPLILRRTVLRAGLAVARRIIPLDVETYLRVHFTKVGDQTRALLASYVDHGRHLGLPTASLEAVIATSRQLP